MGVRFPACLGKVGVLLLSLLVFGGAACSIALAQNIVIVPLETFEGSFPPAGWSVINDGGPVVWHQSDASPNYGAGSYSPLSGLTAYAESYPAYCGYAYDTSLVSPEFSTEGMEVVKLRFAFQYWVYSTEYLALDYRIDGGPWVHIENLPSLGGYTAETREVDLSFAAGNPSVQVRWRYYNPGSGCDWWTQIDNVEVVGSTPYLVPTVQTWGLVLLALLLAGFGVAVNRRNRAGNGG
jgi:hypothetical protein